MNNISWGSYWSALTIMVIIYYAYVFLVYYRSDLRNRLAGKDGRLSAGSFQPTHLGKEDQEHFEKGGDELLPVLQSIIDEMVAYLGQAAYANAGKPEIIFALQQIAKKYGEIKITTHWQAVNKLVQFECKDKCGVHLNEEEIQQVWCG